MTDKKSVNARAELPEIKAGMPSSGKARSFSEAIGMLRDAPGTDVVIVIEGPVEHVYDGVKD